MKLSSRLEQQRLLRKARQSFARLIAALADRLLVTRISPDAGDTFGPDLVDRWKARAFQQDPSSETPCCGYEEEDTNWGGSSTLLGERESFWAQADRPMVSPANRTPPAVRTPRRERLLSMCLRPRGACCTGKEHRSRFAVFDPHNLAVVVQDQGCQGGQSAFTLTGVVR